MTKAIRTRFGSVNSSLRCVIGFKNTQSILFASSFRKQEFIRPKFCDLRAMYLREISGAEDTVMYLPYKDDKHERAAKTRSEACSDNFRHPTPTSAEYTTRTMATHRCSICKTLPPPSARLEKLLKSWSFNHDQGTDARFSIPYRL